jgi:hypothetical protein
MPQRRCDILVLVYNILQSSNPLLQATGTKAAKGPVLDADALIDDGGLQGKGTRGERPLIIQGHVRILLRPMKIIMERKGNNPRNLSQVNAAVERFPFVTTSSHLLARDPAWSQVVTSHGPYKQPTLRDSFQGAQHIP